MPARLFSALFVSIALVGGALWIRLSNNAGVQYELALVEPDTKESDILNYFLESNSGNPSVPAKTLPKTEILGRGLLAEYINLASSGGVTQEEIEALANKYVESITNLSQINTISYGNLKIVSNEKNNFQKYADEITKIHQAYTKGIEQEYKASNINTLDSSFYSLASVISIIYDDTASKLKKMPVPQALANIHLELINMYLLNAYSMEAISETEDDSAGSFAGLVALSDNVYKETAIFSEISRVLNANGI